MAYSRREQKRAYADTKRAALNLIKLERGCARCGYNEHASALDWHHRDPSTKELTLGRVNASLERLIAETEKCDVLCANCHRVEHHKEARSAKF